MGEGYNLPPFFMSDENKLLNKINRAMSGGNFSSAIESLDKVLSKKPSNLNLLMLRGEAHLRLENFESALRDLAKVVEADNKNITALVNFSVALIRCSMQNDAKPVLEYALELDPKNFDAHINLCNIYQSLGQSEESLKLAIRAIEIRPNSMIAYNNLGTAFGDLNMIKEAREALSIAHQLDPTYVTTAINLAQIEVKLANFAEAAQLYEKLLLLKNISPSELELVKYYLSYCYLHLGKISEGWDNYEFGSGSLLPGTAYRSRRKFVQPKWNGEEIKGKKLLIWREQGLGDEIEFSTCLTDVFELKVDVILECDPRLVEIFQRTFPTFHVRPESIRVDYFPATDDFDFQCAVGSLPRLFRRDIKSFEREITPLKIKDYAIEEFRSRLSEYSQKKLIGICWRSGIFSIGRNLNYTALVDWRELLTQNDFHFVNLQYGDCESELLEIENLLGINIIRWQDLDLKNDLENLFGLIKNLDAVVTVGTAVSSIAASCNVPTYLLMKPSWLMLGQKDHYPWFRSVTPLVAENAHIAEKIKLIPDLIRNQ
jgi:tetratricopeptide (TPR) repeat protein